MNRQEVEEMIKTLPKTHRYRFCERCDENGNCKSCSGNKPCPDCNGDQIIVTGTRTEG